MCGLCNFLQCKDITMYVQNQGMYVQNQGMYVQNQGMYVQNQAFFSYISSVLRISDQ